MRANFPSLGRAILAGILLALTSCSPPRLPPATAVVLVEMPFRNLDPLKATDAVSQKIGNLMHSALVRTDEHMRLVGELAESWTHEGYRRFHFKLKAGQKFHDGSPLTAESVLASYKEFQGETPHRIALARVKRMWVTSPLDFHVETLEPLPFFVQDLPLLKVFKRVGGRVIGAGLFRPESETPNEVVLKRVEPVTDGFQTIAFRYVRDETTRYQLLMRGDGNVSISSLSVTKTHHIEEHLPPGFSFAYAKGINFSYLCFNFRNPILADLRVRRAIAHAVDIDSLLKYRIGNLGYRATGILSPALVDYYEPNVRAYEFDRAKAERLLDEAGYPRKGRWRFSLHLKTTTEKLAFDLANLVAGQLRSIGIDARIDTVEAATFFNDIKVGRFDIFHSRWIGVNNPSIYFRAFHSSQANGGNNRGAYRNEQMDEWISKGLTEVDDKKRKDLFSRVQKLAAEELPYLNLWYWNNTFIGTKNMRNVIMYPNGNFRALADIRL